MTECKVCLVKHDNEIHEATLRVRAWFKDWVLQGRSVIDLHPVMNTSVPMYHAQRHPRYWKG